MNTDPVTPKRLTDTLVRLIAIPFLPDELRATLAYNLIASAMAAGVSREAFESYAREHYPNLLTVNGRINPVTFYANSPEGKDWSGVLANEAPRDAFIFPPLDPDVPTGNTLPI